MRLIDTAKGQSTLIAGFTLSGMTRVLSIYPASNSPAAIVYLSCMTLATAGVLVCAVTFATMNTFIIDFPGEKRFRYVAALRPIINLFMSVFSVAMLSFFIALALLPW